MLFRSGVTEYHVMIHATDPKQTYREQMNVVLDAYAALLKKELSGAVAVFKRYFLSDAANQAELLLAATAESSDCALSVVEQPPLDGTKIALWAYLQTDVQTRVLPNGLYEVKHGAYRQLWMGGSFNRAANSEYQMRLLLNDYAMQLMEEGCTLADNCLRTWIFVQNVDCNYAGVVKARNEMFVTQNLTENTHYIASTGIGVRHADPKALVMLDAFAVAGLKPGLGVCKELHAVGDLFITGIVAGCSHYDPMMLQSIRLALVMQLADCISAGIGLVENFCLDAASV